MRLMTLIWLFLGVLVIPALAQDHVPKNVAGSVGNALQWAEGQFYSVAEAMPESKYGYIPTAGQFDGVRSFAEQVKHVACANYGFFNEIEGKIPPEGCEKGGPSQAKTKAELLKYLKESFDYGNKVLETIDAKNALDRVEGPYAGPNTKLGIAVAAVWHVADHYWADCRISAHERPRPTRHTEVRVESKVSKPEGTPGVCRGVPQVLCAFL
ncbi:MAG: DinB family protein [Terriglobales bacterium]